MVAVLALSLLAAMAARQSHRGNAVSRDPGETCLRLSPSSPWERVPGMRAGSSAVLLP